ncbi:MAG: PD40 domain-containing protein [Pyrinomonadaceae bacterium]|nr:PD40 domain-containing protein [Pyrinomonadaceae bacterium]
MMGNLLAWNFSPDSSFGYQLFARGGVLSDSPLSPAFHSGTDVRFHPGFDFFAMPMPQAGSSKIVFTSNRDGSAQIYSMNVDGSSLTRLTTNAYNDDHPRWSPNGTKILFQSDRDNPETGNYDIYVMNANGTSQTRLTYDATDDSAAEWSPDGSKIVFQSLRNGQFYQVYVMNADGTNQANTSGGFAPDYQPSWSPNGAKIAFASERDHAGRPSVYVMKANGSNQTRLTFTGEPFRDEQPAWSRDATKIAFVSTRDSVIETWQETDDEGGILNRSRVRTNKEVYKMNADGSNQIRLTTTLENDDSPSWSPDGTQIVFRSDRERDAYDPTQQLWTMIADGTSQALISSNDFGDYSPSWKATSNQPPLANGGGPYSGLSGSSIQFNGGGSFDPDGAIASYQWNFGDNTSGAGITPTHSYSTAGSYTVTLTVTDNDGATANATATATVANNPPVANPGGPYSGVTAQNIPFNGSGSSDSDGTITSYAWSFGDGGTGLGAVPTHAYTSAGTYTVMLTVTDNQGAQASANTSVTITVAGSEQYLANFNQAALARGLYPNESAYWNDLLRAAYANGQNSMLLAVRELGKTLFESSYYAARLDRQGTQHDVDYVYDLYKTYLMREPDAPGWAFWTDQCEFYGRENVRRAFDESGEFAGIVATLTPSGSPSSAVSSFASARVDRFNQPGNGLASRDAEWSVPLLSLPGRAGLDLGLSLSYSSMVWTRSGPYIYFDEDNGWPSPGFRLGFPTIQEKVFDAQAGDNVYLLISGNRVSLRQVGTSNVYEGADSSYLQLIDNGGSLLLRATDGTQLGYSKFNNEWHCMQIKDRNGNYITVNYDWLGHITTIIDTLARTITFNYDTNANLTSITQSWTVNGVPTTHTWATFGWTNMAVNTSFSGVMGVGAPNGSTIPVLSQVGLGDGSRHTFEYSTAGQVSIIKRFAQPSDNTPRAYVAYDYEYLAADCPRLSATRVAAENWTGINGVPSEVVTQYGVEGSAHTLTVVGDPNSTLYKEFYGAGWQRGLTTQTEVWSAGVKQKWTSNNWTQDNTGVNYKTNPRVTESNVYDSGGNHRRTTIDYQTFTLPSGVSCSLPSDMREYAGDASTILRRSHTNYLMDPVADAAYLSRHIIGLVKEQSLFEVNTSGETLMSKVGFQYDDTGSIQGTGAPVGHDNSYDGNFVAGRGNLSSVKRYNVINSGQWTVSSVQYNTAGAVVASIDPLSHRTTISYADSFSDGNNSRSTLAYPTTVTDADGFSSTVTYNFDFGAVTRKQTPQPNTIANLPGPVQTFLYDAAGRIERITATTNGAYQRFVYGPNYVQQFGSVNNLADDSSAIQVFDGTGRVFASASAHPGSTGGRSAIYSIHDAMGRRTMQSNPTEINGDWVPVGDDATGWLFTQQTYNWQGKPLVTTNTDGTTKEASYSGCGCAGGEVVTLADEVVILPPQSGGGVMSPDRRKRKVHADVLGRTVKSEILNRDGTPYMTTVTEYNARDQVKAVKEYKGAAVNGSCPATTCQQTTTEYDGYGRLKRRHLPEQNAGAVTTWSYNNDHTVDKITDARGASRTFGYNARRLVTSITYAWPGGGTVPTPASFGYDAAGNRTSMTDSTGSVTYHYDQLSRMDWEERTFAGLYGATYRLTYGSYNLAGQLTSLAEPSQFGSSVGYGYDEAGRLEEVTGSSFPDGVASELKYRASGALKEMSYGNGSRLNNSFNSRLQITSYQVKVPGTPVGQDEAARSEYEYDAGGRITRAYDRTDPGFDRSYLYDLVGRLMSASTVNSAYYQNFSYDEFDNLTVRSNGSWRYHDTTLMQYANNRNISTTVYPNGVQPRTSYWVYDADGNVTNDHNKQYTYDAAGNKRLVFENTDTRSLWLHQDYDADGERVKRVEQNLPAGGVLSTVTSYYLRSSVLDSVVVELDQNGQKRESYVYANGVVIAQQKNNQVQWVHVDPVTASLRETNGLRREVDPLGNDAPLSDPAPPDEATPDYLYTGTYGNSGNNLDTQSGCSIDGQPMDCSFAVRLVSMGVAAQCPDNRCGPRHNGNSWEFWNASTGWVASNVRKRKPPKLKFLTKGELAEMKRIKKQGGINPSGGGDDENSPFDVGTITTRVSAALATPECIEFYKTVLNGVSNKSNPVLHGGDLRQIFTGFLGQPNGGFTRRQPPGASGPANGNAFGIIGSKNYPAGIYLNESSLRLQNFWDAFFTVGELFHVAGSKGTYSDEALSKFIHNHTKYADREDELFRPEENIFSPRYTNQKDGDEYGYSSYFHRIQQSICFVPR